MNHDEMIDILDEAVERFQALRDNTDEYGNSLHEQIGLSENLYNYIIGSDGKSDEKPLDRIFMDAESEIQGRLPDLPFDLARYGMVDEAVDLSRRYADVCMADNFLADIAVILAEACGREEAIKQTEENLISFPDDVWDIIKAGDVFESLKDHKKAVEIYERAYEVTMPRTFHRAQRKTQKG